MVDFMTIVRCLSSVDHRKNTQRIDSGIRIASYVKSFIVHLKFR
jgi:hypothetical protein